MIIEIIKYLFFALNFVQTTGQNGGGESNTIIETLQYEKGQAMHPGHSEHGNPYTI